MFPECSCGPFFPSVNCEVSTNTTISFVLSDPGLGRNSKGNQSWIFIGRTDAEVATRCEELTHCKRPWCWEGLKMGGEGDDRGGWHHRLNGHEFEQTLEVGDGPGSLVCCSPWGDKESDTTEWLNWLTDWGSNQPLVQLFMGLELQEDEKVLPRAFTYSRTAFPAPWCAMALFSSITRLTFLSDHEIPYQF